MSEMVERVAKAIEAEMGGKSIDMARAAIEAMREPTDAMLDASGIFITDNARAFWRAMIDGALGKVDA